MHAVSGNRTHRDFEPAIFILELMTKTKKSNAEHVSNLLILNPCFRANGSFECTELTL